jgi:CPA2 family monovalent cation:H+ antiporter-2
MNETASPLLSNHAIIAGYGIPGRAVGEKLFLSKTPFCVIEMNRQTVERCAHGGVQIIEGDVASESVLRQAGIERAALFVAAVPNETAVLEAVRIARRLNPRVHILARCNFISAAMEARRRGANHVVAEEQLVAEEFSRLLDLPR